MRSAKISREELIGAVFGFAGGLCLGHQLGWSIGTCLALGAGFSALVILSRRLSSVERLVLAFAFLMLGVAAAFLPRC